MSGLVKDVHTKCAGCGSSARLKFDVSFEPWRYVAVCNNCTQRGAPCVTQTQAIEDWDRRQKEEMAEKKKREYIVVATKKEEIGAEYFLCGTDDIYAMQKAKELLNAPDLDRVFIAQIIGYSENIRQITRIGDDEC